MVEALQRAKSNACEALRKAFINAMDDLVKIIAGLIVVAMIVAAVSFTIVVFAANPFLLVVPILILAIMKNKQFPPE